MSFPTTPVLDTFNRPDEGPPPSSNWTNGIILGPGFYNLAVSSNTCVALVNPGEAYWNAGSYGPDSQVFVDIATRGTDDIFLFLRLTTPGQTTTNGYFLDIGPVMQINRLDNSASTTLGDNFTASIVSGDSVCFEAIGSTFSAYKRSGSNWDLMARRSDSTHNERGFLGLQLAGATPSIDGFGGGTVAEAGQFPTRHGGRGAGW